MSGPTDRRLVVAAPAMDPNTVVVEGAPVHVCRPWLEGDERHGRRVGRCMVPHCPHTLAVSPGHWSLEHQYICVDDAAAYGLLPPPAVA